MSEVFVLWKSAYPTLGLCMKRFGMMHGQRWKEGIAGDGYMLALVKKAVCGIAV